MNAEDYKILINKVWFRGFWVPGIANQRVDFLVNAQKEENLLSALMK